MKSTVRHKLSLAGFFITLFGALLFSTKAILVKKAFAATDIDAVSLLTLRMAFSLPFYLLALFVVGRRESDLPLTRRQIKIVVGLGLLGYYFSSLFDFIGLQYISAGLERLILFLYPTFVVLINRLVFRQPVRRVHWIAMLLTYAGLACAFAGEASLSSAKNFWWGSFLVFCCAVTYAVYLAGSGRLIPQIGANRFTAWAMLSATGGVFAHYLIAKGSPVSLLHGAYVPYGLLLAVVATVTPSFLLARGLKKIGANSVAIVSTVGPVSTILQAHYFLGEEITAGQVAGTVLVVAGILLLGWRRKKSDLEM